MRTNNRSKSQYGRRGSTLIEIMIALGLFATVFVSSLALMDSGSRFSKSTLDITTTEDLAQQMLFRIERLLASGAAMAPLPATQLSGTLGAGDTGVLTLASSDGMPPRGFLLLDRGTATEERIRYDQLAVGALNQVSNLTRGLQCTADVDHGTGSEAHWAGLGVTTPTANPLPGNFDGFALEAGNGLFFTGDGTGFVFRQPIDPAGGNVLLNGDDLVWGAEVRGVGQTVDGRMAIYFEPQTVFDEAAEGVDVNNDGDELDRFDIGQLRRVTWDVTNPNMDDDTGLGTSVVMQEQCNWGGDLDSDGFDDPLFLWNPDTQELHIRIFILGVTKSGLPIVRRVESIIFLRNQAEDAT